MCKGLCAGVQFAMSSFSKKPDFSDQPLYEVMDDDVSEDSEALPDSSGDEYSVGDGEARIFRPHGKENLEDPYVDDPHLIKRSPGSAVFDGAGYSDAQVMAEVNGEEPEIWDEREPDAGQAEGFEEAEAELIRAAEGGYVPPQNETRDGEDWEAHESTAAYGEADSEHPQDFDSTAEEA